MVHAAIFRGGIPYGPQVAKLVTHFGTPSPGVIEHGSIEGVIGEKWRSTRYRQVVGAWRRKMLREWNVGTKAEMGEGIRVLTEAERVEEGRRMVGQNARHVLRAHRWVLMVDAAKLDDVAKKRHEHLTLFSARMSEAASTNAKALAETLKAPAQLPRAIG